MALEETTPRNEPRPATTGSNVIPPREHFRPRRDSRTPPQPTIRTHLIRLGMATAACAVLMLVLLLFAVQFLNHNWSSKQKQAKAAGQKRHASVAKSQEEGAALEVSGSNFVLPPAAPARFLKRLGTESFSRKNGWHLLARALSEETDSHLVLAALRMTIAAKGESAEVRNDLGTTYLRQRKLKQATEQFVAAGQLQPGFAPALYNLALCALSERQPDRAVGLLGSYLAQRPTDVSALRLQSTLLAQLGHPDRALVLLEKFLKSQPSNQPLFLEAAQLAARRGQNKKALRYLETALNGNHIQTVARTYQSAVFREIRLSGEGDILAARMAELARLTYSPPLQNAEIHPMRESSAEGLLR